MVQCYDTKYTGLKKKEVIDVDGDKLGKVMDFIITVDGTKLTPKSMIIGGGRIEELLEAIKVKKDVDPIFDIDQIDVVEEDVIRLKVDGEKLCDTYCDTAILDNDIKLSELSKAKVIDSDDFSIGNVIDIWWDTEGDIWLVVGGGFFEETMEKLKIIPDIDLLVHSRDLEEVTEKQIKLKLTRFQLEANCQNQYERYKREVMGKEKRDDSRYAHLRLGQVPSRGMA
jgi:sporulation protein YlmC with PRC-barrel domain